MIATQTLEDLTQRVEAELRDIFSTREMPLYRMMAYHLGWEDQQGGDHVGILKERNYGLACLIACQASGGESDSALPAAASVELINSSCEVHDDVQGGRPKRDGRDSVWWVWGPAQGINAGDGLHALARLAMFRLEDRGLSPETTFRAVHLLDEASLQVCEGRFRDLEAQERIDMSVEAYIEMAGSITGAMYSCAMRLGALVGGADEPLMDALGEYGAHLGIAAQVREDARLLWDDARGRESPEDDVLNKKKLFPVVYALEKADVSIKRRLGEIYFKRVLEPKDVDSLRAVLDDLGARERCDVVVGEHRERAMAAAGGASLSQDRMGSLEALADSLLSD